MKKSDNKIHEMLQNEVKKGVEKTEIPLRLQRESVVEMIKNSEKIDKDFSDKTGTERVKNNNIFMLRKATAIAAMLAIVLSSVLAMKTGDQVKAFREDLFYESYKDADTVKNARSYEEVEQVIKEIFGGDDNSEEKATDISTQNSVTDKNETSAVQSTQKKNGSIIAGYSEYVAAANQNNNEQAETEPVLNTNEPDGVAKYGDFKADIVKNNGEYLYLATTGSDAETGDIIEQIKIVKTDADGKMANVSSIVLSEGSGTDNLDECIEIYLKNNLLTVILKRNVYTVLNDKVTAEDSTVAVYYDITDPNSPEKIREHVQDGKYISSNLYDNRLCIVTKKEISEAARVSGEDIIPDFSINGEERKPKAEEIFIAVNDPEATYLFVTVTDTAQLSEETGCLAILGGEDKVYCSSSCIAVAREFVSVEADKKGEHESLTEIYRFNINDNKIAFSGSYIVQGTLVSGISIDENNGYMRVVTSDKGSSNIYVLNEKTEFISGLKGIFPSKTISGVKFIGNNCYVTVDKLIGNTMIIDFSEPSAPFVAGKITEKTYSDDLYAVSDTLLLGITKSDDKSVELTLFDVSNPGEPKTVAVHKMDESYHTISADDSRRVMLISDKKIFGIPVVKINEENGTEISGYALFDASEGKIEEIGVYNHDAYVGDAAVRGICIGDILYTVSGEKIVAFPINDGSLNSINQKEFPLN